MGAHFYTAAIRQLAVEIAFICYRARRISGETCLSLCDVFGYDAVRFEARYQSELADAEQAMSRSAECAGERE